MDTTLPASLAAALSAGHTPQRGFSWKPESWSAALVDCPEVVDQLNSLPDRIDRDEVCRVVTANLSLGKVLSAFVTSMIWGYGDSGYGPARVRWVLTGIRGRKAAHAPVLPDVAERLQAAAHVVRERGPVEGFRHMNNSGRIKYLGSAFFTKWLYFASALSGPDDPKAAPILDKRVRDWLAENARVHLNITKTADYQRYLELLVAWGGGSHPKRSAVQVEKVIFGLATGR